MDISSVLSQLRTLRAQSLDLPFKPVAAGMEQGQGQVKDRVQGFKDTMQEALSKVNQVQEEATQSQQKFEMGDPNMDVTRVMLQMQQSRIAFAATVEVRNRLVNAYQEVMNMPL